MSYTKPLAKPIRLIYNTNRRKTYLHFIQGVGNWKYEEYLLLNESSALYKLLSNIPDKVVLIENKKNLTSDVAERWCKCHRHFSRNLYEFLGSAIYTPIYLFDMMGVGPLAYLTTGEHNEAGETFVIGKRYGNIVQESAMSEGMVFEFAQDPAEATRMTLHGYEMSAEDAFKIPCLWVPLTFAPSIPDFTKGCVARFVRKPDWIVPRIECNFLDQTAIWPGFMSDPKYADALDMFYEAQRQIFLEYLQSSSINLMTRIMTTANDLLVYLRFFEKQSCSRDRKHLMIPLRFTID